MNNLKISRNLYRLGFKYITVYDYVVYPVYERVEKNSKLIEKIFDTIREKINEKQ